MSYKNIERGKNKKSKKIKVLLVSFNLREEPSLATSFLKSYAYKFPSIRKRFDIEIKNFLTNKDDLKVLCSIKKQNPSIVGFSCYMWNIKKVLSIIKMIKEIMPKTLVVVGGPEITPIAEKYVGENQEIDLAVVGEGERVFVQVLRSFLNKTPFQKIKGIVLRKNKEVIFTGHAALIRNLDEIPSPFINGFVEIRGDNTPLETYRGCVYKCAYCFEGKNYPFIRRFSVSRIKREIMWLKRHGVKSIWLINSAFNYDKEYVKKVCNMITEINSNKEIHFSVDSRAELLDEEIVQLYKNANITLTEVGLQTTDSETLRNINRYFDPKRFSENARLLNKAGIKFQIDIIAGLPGDNFFSSLKTMEFAIKQKPMRITAHILSILPGTELFHKKKSFSIIFNPEPPYHILSSYSSSIQEILKTAVLLKRMAKEYNAKKNQF